MITFKDQAIQSAIDCKWEEAIEANKAILEENPEDIDSLNRLGFALMQEGKLKEAQDTFQKVLQIDESNPIATKNINKLSSLPSSSKSNSNGQQILRVNTFIEEAGKTKTVNLINITDKKTISNMQPGQQVQLKIKRSKIFILSPEEEYIGMLPQDVGIRIIEFLNEGNKYEAFLKAVDEKAVTVFIRECYRCKRLAKHPTFPSTPPPQKKMKRRFA